jgi:surfeit locus 1 family protein
MADARPPGRAGRAGLGRLILLSLVCWSLVAGFCGLGIWQLHRRTWKLNLIARVQHRIHAAPIPAPGPGRWPTLTPGDSEYLRVRVVGRFDNAKETLVQAVTELGPGFWVMTPLETRQGFIVLVNRGFVPPERRAPSSRSAGQIVGDATVVGLLRRSEPHGGFLRANAPREGRWYSRDVAAIARTRGLRGVAPYFIDAEASPGDVSGPTGGLTVVRFPNSHLVYALTWFGLAALAGAAGVILVSPPRQRR